MDASPTCPVCLNANQNILIERRGVVPTLQNTTLATIDEARNYPTGSLSIHRCTRCSFVWNADFDTDSINYDRNYNNDVSTSDYYIRHLHAMVDRVLAAVPADQPIHYVEVGCGEGDFLNLVVQRSAGRCVSAVGFDPSFTGEATLSPSAVVHRQFFGEEQLALIPAETNIVCSRHTIEHVPDVRGFAGALAAAVQSPERRLFIETPDANWILQEVAFQDLFYEHCSLFTPASMTRLMADQNLDAKVESVYDGQYMWTEATRSLELLKPSCGTVVEESPEVLATQYSKQQSKMRSQWVTYLRDRSEVGPVAIWGGASKGVTFALLLGLEPTVEIECVIDLNPAKQGRFLPTTGLPVVAPEEAKRRGVRTVVIMNPNYVAEIQNHASKMSWFPEFTSLNVDIAGPLT